MKIYIVSILFLLGLLIRGNSQMCYDSLTLKPDLAPLTSSQKFTTDVSAFFSFAKEKKFTKIDSACKGTEFVKRTLKNLAAACKNPLLLKGTKVYALDSYCMNNGLMANFGLIEICYSSIKEAKVAFNNFKHKPFVFGKAEMRIYRPLRYKNKLMMYFTASLDNQEFAKFYRTIGVKDFL
jgi:hypothetical protein